MPATRRVRAAWATAGSVSAVALLAFGSLQAASLLAHTLENTHRTIAAAIRNVDVRTVGGSVHIHATDDHSVAVDATISRGLSSPLHHETVQGDRLVVIADCPGLINTFCGVNYTIALPRGDSARVRSSGGDITVVDIDGDLDLSSSGGGVNVTGGHGSQLLNSSGGGISVTGDLATSLVARSSGGGVHVTFLAPPLDVAASSSGGGVSVTLPDTPDAYHVIASSSGGSTRTDVRTDPTSPRIIRTTSSGGDVVVGYPNT